MSDSHQPSMPLSREEKSWFSEMANLLGPIGVRWRLVLVCTLLAAIGSVIGSLCLKNQYRAAATMVLANNSSDSKLSSIGSLMSGDLGSLVGMKLGSSPDAQILRTIFPSNALRDEAIRKFQLVRVWKLDTTKPIHWEDLDKIWAKNFNAAMDDDEVIYISFQSPDSILSKQVVDFSETWIDSSVQSFHHKRAMENARFYSSRVQEQDSLLNEAQTQLLNFQQKYRIIQPESQVIEALKVSVDLESTVKKMDVEIDMEAARNGNQSSSLKALQEARRHTRDILDKIITNDSKSKSGNAGNSYIYKNISATIGLAAEYERLYRNVELHRHALILLIEANEQLALEIQKNTPIMAVVDPALLPSRKSAPSRSVIVIVVTFLVFVSSCGMAWMLGYLQQNRVTFKRVRQWFQTGVW